MTARIVVEVRGGCVVAVHADQPCEVEVLDWDDVNASDDPELDEASALALLEGLAEVWP